MKAELIRLIPQKLTAKLELLMVLIFRKEIDTGKMIVGLIAFGNVPRIVFVPKERSFTELQG